MSDQDEPYSDAQGFRYGSPGEDDAPVLGDPETIKTVTKHIERHVGPVAMVFHEVRSSYVHIDVHHVIPGPGHPYHVLVTSGMSECAMRTPAAVPDDFRYAELLVCLPDDWPISGTAFEDERHFWPVRWLMTLARFPHASGTWLGYGHTVPSADPPEPLGPGTGLSGLMVLQPLLLGEAVHRLDIGMRKTIRFFSLVPLYSEEMDLKVRKGSGALLRRLERAGVTDLIDPDRVNVALRRGWWPL